MFSAPLGDSSMLPGAVVKLMDEGLDAGERVSKKKKEHFISKIDTVSILTTTQKMSLF